MSSWLDSLMKILERLLKAAPALLAYLTGRKHAAKKAEDKAQDATDKAEAEQDENNRDYERLRRNQSLRDRLRDIMRKKQNAAGDGDVQE